MVPGPDSTGRGASHKIQCTSPILQRVGVAPRRRGPRLRHGLWYTRQREDPTRRHGEAKMSVHQHNSVRDALRQRNEPLLPRNFASLENLPGAVGPRPPGTSLLAIRRLSADPPPRRRRCRAARRWPHCPTKQVQCAPQSRRGRREWAALVRYDISCRGELNRVPRNTMLYSVQWDRVNLKARHASV